MKKLKLYLSQRSPVSILIAGYLLLTLFGFALLSLPWVQSRPTPFLDNLFISASAISTTGLTTVSVSDHYNFAGQLAVLVLIQIGGLGYMTFGSFVMVSRRKKLSKMEEQMIQNDFGLPKSFDSAAFIRMVVYFTLAVEALGAAGLYFVFKRAGVPEPLWQAVFHSVSAFCTAGFSLFNSSFESFGQDPALNLIIIALSVLGAVGFLAVSDLWQRLRGVKKEVTFTTRIILGFTALAMVMGWGLLLLTEPLFQGRTGSSWMPAMFQSMTAMTTVGFNSVPMASLSHGTLYLMTILMIVGASPAGTGGGIKSTTIVAVLAETFATLQGRRIVMFFKRVIPDYRLVQAAASFNFYILLLTFGVYLLSLTDAKTPIFELIFEATSAIGTVGLSTGITAGLTEAGKAVIILLMMLGRIGPLTIGLALFRKKHEGEDDLWDAKYEDLVID